MSLLRHMKTHSTVIAGALVVVVISTFVVLRWKDNSPKPADRKKRSVSNKKDKKVMDNDRNDVIEKLKVSESHAVVTDSKPKDDSTTVDPAASITSTTANDTVQETSAKSMQPEIGSAELITEMTKNESPVVDDLSASIIELSATDDELSSSFVTVSAVDLKESANDASSEFQPLELTSFATEDDDNEDEDNIVSVVELGVISEMTPTPTTTADDDATTTIAANTTTTTVSDVATTGTAKVLESEGDVHSSTISCATSSSGDQDINTPVHEDIDTANNDNSESINRDSKQENIDFSPSSGISEESKPFVFRAQLDSNSTPFTLNKQEWPSLGTSSSGMDISAPVFVPQALREHKSQAKNNAKKHLSRAQLIEQQRQNYTPSAKARCNHWPFCTNKNCKFWHPFKMCRSGDDCHFGDKCVFVHPRDCRT